MSQSSLDAKENMSNQGEEAKASPKKKQRRVIDDDSDEDEDSVEKKEGEMQVEKAPIVVPVTQAAEQAPVEKKQAEPSKPASSSSKKKVATKRSSSGLTAFQRRVAANKAAAAAKKASGAPSAFFQPKAVSHKDPAPATEEADKKEEAPSTNDAPADRTSEDTPVVASDETPAPTGTVHAHPSQLYQDHKKSFTSDLELLQEIPSTWTTTLPYGVLCDAFSKIEAITGRLDIQQIMTHLFRQILLESPRDLYPAMYLASNQVAPAYECVELGIGDAILIKAIGEATGTNPSMVKAKYESVGDLGSVAQSFKSKQKTLGGFFGASKPKAGVSVTEVLQVFREIADMKGNQSQKWKTETIKKLLVKASTGSETKYIIRGLQGKLRIGLAQSTVLISLAHALALTVPDTVTALSDDTEEVEYPDEVVTYLDTSVAVEKRLEAAVAILKKAYSEVPSFDAILDAALKVPLEEMHRACSLVPGIPVVPMLAKPTKSVQEVLKRLNGLKFTCEYKYDGERCQVHLLPDGTTKVFSRNLLETTEKYPEVPVYVREACKDVTSFVLDAEVVAYNKDTGKLVPFQILSTRKKSEESHESAKVKVIVEAFDIMYLNGESLLSKTLSERRALLQEHFTAVQDKFQFATYLDHEEDGDTTVLEDFLDAAVKGQCEGLMVKTLDVNANYEPSKRSLNWLKLKKDYLEGLGDSVDLVPLGAYYGRGKRTGVYGAYLLACYDPDTEEFQSVCKIGTGFSDSDLKTLTEDLNKHKIPQKSSQYNTTDQLECDVWFDAVQVWEVKAADLSKSSAHRGAVGKTGESNRGIGLRFPRFERVRDDKQPHDATTSDQILDMYYAQDTVANGGGGMDVDDDGI